MLGRRPPLAKETVQVTESVSERSGGAGSAGRAGELVPEWKEVLDQARCRLRIIEQDGELGPEVEIHAIEVVGHGLRGAMYLARLVESAEVGQAEGERHSAASKSPATVASMPMVTALRPETAGQYSLHDLLKVFAAAQLEQHKGEAEAARSRQRAYDWLLATTARAIHTGRLPSLVRRHFRDRAPVRSHRGVADDES